MRASFVKTLVELAEKDPRILLLTADLGFMALEPFSEKFPSRFFNVGVAEQNMIGMATGMAESGFIPFVYSIATFATLRPYEFIRNGPILHQLPVRIIGIGGGFEYGHAGLTHHGVDDVGALRVQPGIKIYSPIDGQQTKTVIEKTWNSPGPIYYRLGKNDKLSIPEVNGEFEEDQVQLVQEGKDVLILSMGSITHEASMAAKALKEKGISAKVVAVSSINPAPVKSLINELQNFSNVYTVEAHYINGGLGSTVCEIIAENNIPAKVTRLGVQKLTDGKSGNEHYYHDLHGLTSEKIAQKITQHL